MINKTETINRITLHSADDVFPLIIQFVDNDETTTDYILFKTRKGKLILQKPLCNYEVMSQTHSLKS
jgi:hypothetical protein